MFLFTSFHFQSYSRLGWLLENVGASKNNVILLMEMMSTCVVSKIFVLDHVLLRVTVEEGANAGEWCICL